MTVRRNQRAGIDDRWTKRVKGDDGEMRTVDSSLKGKVSRWRVRWVDESGKEHSKSFERKPNAKACLEKLTADVVRGDYVDPRKGAVTFEVVAKSLMATKGHRKPKTVAGYRSLLETVIYPRWRNVALKDITFEQYSSWLAGLSVDGGRSGKGLSASRVGQAHQLVGMVLKYAQKSGKLAKNVAAEIGRHDLPEDAEREPRFLTSTQLLGLAAKCERFETLTLVLGFCGLRFGEAVALRRGHVGDRQLTIKESATGVTGKGVVIGSTKTGRVRRVAVPVPIWERLETELPVDSNKLVFPSRRGYSVVLPTGEYRWVFNKAVVAMQKEAAQARAREIAEDGKPITSEFPGITPHDLRHTAASLAISVGANIKVVQNMLGHATAAMTLDRYGHLLTDDQTRVADALGELMETTAVSLRSRAKSKNAKAS